MGPRQTPKCNGATTRWSMMSCKNRRWFLRQRLSSKKHDRHPHSHRVVGYAWIVVRLVTAIVLLVMNVSTVHTASALSPLTTSKSASTMTAVGFRRAKATHPQLESSRFPTRHVARTSISISISTTRLALVPPSSPIEETASSSAADEEEEMSTSSRRSSSHNADLLRAQAERIRREAAAMEQALTISKIEAIQGKLGNPAWVKRQTADEQSQLKQQLEILHKKLSDTEAPTTTATATTRVVADSPASVTPSRAPPSKPAENSMNEETAKVIQEQESTPPKSKNRQTASSSSSSFFFADKQDQKPKRKEKVDTTSPRNDKKKSDDDDRPVPSSISSSSVSASKSTSASPSISSKHPSNPYSGFDDEDLALYLPVALEIEALCEAEDKEVSKILANSTNVTNLTAVPASNTTAIVKNVTTLEDKLRLFRSAPELQEHFQRKITAILVEPLQDMQNLQTFREQYLSSNSRVERQNLKRQIASLEKKINNDDTISFSESIFINTPPLEEEEIQERLRAIRALPPLLQGLYLKRTGAPVYEELKDDDDHDDAIYSRKDKDHDDIGDLRLAIELEHYETQMQLLEQIKMVTPLDDERKMQAIAGVRSLPKSLRLHLAKKLDLEIGDRTDDGLTTLLINAFTGEDNGQGVGGDNDVEEKWSSLMEFNTSSLSSSSSDPSISYSIRMEEYNDIDYIDRSQYVQQMYGAIARMEGQQPSLEDVEQFMTLLDSKKTFMITSKPERVMGGYYIRGENRIDNDQKSGTELVRRLTEKLQQNSTLADKLDFFYIPDPSPLLEEEIEMEYDFKRPILVVTGKQNALFYTAALPSTKVAISALGIFSLLIFSVATVEMQPNLQERLNEALALSSGDGQDLMWLMNTVAPVFLSISAIQFAHELAHRIVAWKDDFRVGLPTLIPSVQMGLLGSITPLKSPPPSMRSLFDFALAGPVAGLLVSLLFFVSGLSISSTMDISAASNLPALPLFILRSSALGGGLIEFFLGKGAILNGPSEAVLQMHPFAIAGFAGLVMNALALLPIGNTDGGRVSTAMFGRSATYLIGSGLSILLAIFGLFGADESRILLTYILFSVIWQSELETPARNEVEEVDLARGFFAIATGLVVALILCPLPA